MQRKGKFLPNLHPKKAEVEFVEVCSELDRTHQKVMQQLEDKIQKTQQMLADYDSMILKLTRTA